MDGRVRVTADACVLPQLRSLESTDVFVLLHYGWLRASDCRRVRAAAATDTQMRMTTDVFVLLHYGWLRASDCHN